MCTIVLRVKCFGNFLSLPVFRFNIRINDRRNMELVAEETKVKCVGKNT